MTTQLVTDNTNEEVTWLDSFRSVLDSLGLRSEILDEGENQVPVAYIGASSNPLPVQFQIGRPFPGLCDHLTICCMLGKLGDIKEHHMTEFLLQMADMNTRIAPFAMGVLTDADVEGLDDQADWPIVLINRMPIGDLSYMEIDIAIRSLMQSLMSVKDIMTHAMSDEPSQINI